MNDLLPETPPPPRSFRLSPGHHSNSRVLLGSGSIWLILTEFIAAPFSELWPSILISVILFALAWLLSRTKPLRISATLLLLLAICLSLLSFTS